MTRRISLSLLLALALAACSGTPQPNPQPDPRPSPTDVGQPVGEAVTAVVGPSGGTLASADGALTLTIPVGALSEDETLSIQEITNFAPGRLGGAYRLGPEGQTFAKPVTLTFTLSDEVGSNPAAELAVAYQMPQRYWTVPDGQSYDAEIRTLTVATTHFSDWSPVAGAQLDPWSARVKVGRTVALSLQICDEDGGFPLPMPDGTTEYAYYCRSNVVLNQIVKNWSVNGVAGGNGAAGRIAPSGPGKATYTAPGQKPAQNPVAVSVQYQALDGGLASLVANITVEDDAGEWSGTITYTEEGSDPWDICCGFEGEGTTTFKQTHTFSVVGVESTSAGTVTLLLEQIGAAEYTDLGHMEKKVYEICQAGGPTILRHHIIYDREIRESGAGKLQLRAQFSLRDGQYRLSLHPRSIETAGAETVIETHWNGCNGTTSDYSYTRSYTGVAGPSSFKVEGTASPDSTAFSGVYDREAFHTNVPVNIHVEWNLAREP